MQLAIVNVEEQTTDNIDVAADDINEGDNSSSRQENLAHSQNSEIPCANEQQPSTVDKFFIHKTWIVCWMIRLGIF